MSENKSFEIDFSESQTISTLPPARGPVNDPQAAQRLSSIWGFHAPVGTEKISGPCALGTLFYFHQIGWNHLPKHQNGRPINEPYIQELKRWSQSPDLLSGSLGTSPASLLKSLRKAGLNGKWYAGNSFNATLAVIQHELNHHRPVLALVNHGDSGNPMLLEWQVVYKMTKDTVSLKHCASENASITMTVEQLESGLVLNYPALSCTIITAEKE